MSDAALAEVHVGRTLCDAWRLDELIDIGGMAAVYAATHHRDGRRGALKLLHREVSLNPAAASRFLREAHIVSAVSHPHALRVIDGDVDDDGTAFFVMELLEGATLRQCAEAAGGSLPAKEALLILDQLLDVVGAVHKAGIVHRDIKPENVFLTTDGEVKLLDFGIARMGEAVPSSRGSDAPSDGVMGSPIYMAPEQACGRLDLVDGQSDLWSVGATMYALLAGEPIHGETAVAELLATVSTRPVRSLASVLPGAHPALTAVVDGALRIERTERWADASAMQAAGRAAYLTMFGHALPCNVCTVCTVSAADSRPSAVDRSHALAAGEGRRGLLKRSPIRARRALPGPHQGRERGTLLVAGALALGALASGSSAPARPAQPQKEVLPHAIDPDGAGHDRADPGAGAHVSIAGGRGR